MATAETPSSGKRFHYAFVIFIGCCCVCAGAYGAILSTVAVYLIPVTTSLGCGAGDWMVWMTLFSIVACLTMPVWGKLLHTKNINVVSTAAALITLVAQLMFAFGTSVIWYWIWGAVLGASLACLGALLPPTLINNWFDKSKSGFFLGIAAACSGLGAFVFAPLFTQFVQMFGWQTTYIANVAISAVLILPFTLFLFKYKPADKGLEPYGRKQGAQAAGAQAGGAQAVGRELTGMTKKEALRSGSFYILAFMLVCITLIYGFNSNMVALAKELVGGTVDAASAAMLGATMVSAASIGNVLSKIAFGAMSDKLGVTPTFLTFTALVVAAFGIWGFAPASGVAMIVAAFLFGCNAAIVNVGFPVLTRALFGDKEYAPIYSTVASVNALLGGVSSTVIGFAYQFLGSYQAAIYAAIAVTLLFGVCFLSIAGRIKKGVAR